MTTPTGRPAQRALLAGLALLAVAGTVTGCAGQPADDDGAPQGFVTGAVVDSERLVAEPGTVAPGGSVDVSFPSREMRGPGFVLERRTDSGWSFEWVISSSGREGRATTAEEYFELDMVWPDGPAHDDEGPEEIFVPREAAPGDYRVCTAPDQPALCAEFTVAADG